MSLYSTKDAYETYLYYLAIKKHFTTSYDFFKYNGKIKTSQMAFENRKDKFFFYKLSKKKDYKDYILANVVVNPNTWIGDIAESEKCSKIYYDWKKKQDSLSYIFQSDLNQLTDSLENSILVIDGQHPKLLRLYSTNNISIETLIIINHFGKIFDYWNRKISDKIIWPDINNRCRKYEPFVSFDKNKMKKILVDINRTYNAIEG